MARPPGAGAGRSEYVYAELADARDMRPYDQAHFYAIVVECSAPRQTKKDPMCALKLVDPSTAGHDDPDLAAGVTLNCFAPDRAQLPHCSKPGDIIRLHRVRVNEHQGKPQLVGAPNLRFAFCLFDGAPGGSDVPYQFNSSTYTFDGREAAILASLRGFASAGAWRLAVHAHIRVEAVRPTNFFDMVAKVLAVDAPQGRPPALFVWDSSDAVPFPATFNHAADQLPPPLRELPLASLAPAELAALPWLGTALPVVVHAPGVELPVPGSWIKLRNCAGVLAAAAQLQGVFTRASSWAPWQPEAALEANYRQRLAAGGPQGVARWAPPSAQWRAACDRPDQPFTSLRRVLGDVPGAAPALYRCLVRLVAHTPGEGALGRMCVRAEACWDAARAEGYRDREAWLFAGSLLLDDATGRVTGDLFGRDAERFLARVTPPCDLAANDRTRERLRAALAACKGTQGAAGEGGPWMDVALASYYPDPQDPWGTVRFRVRHCRLVPAPA